MVNDDDRQAMIEAAAQALFDTRSVSIDYIHEAQGFLSDEEYSEIDNAIKDGDDMKAGRVMRLGAMRVIEEEAKRDANRMSTRDLCELLWHDDD